MKIPYKKRKKRDKTIAIRFTEEEKDMIYEVAVSIGESSVGNWARKILLEAARARKEIIK